MTRIFYIDISSHYKNVRMLFAHTNLVENAHLMVAAVDDERW